MTPILAPGQRVRCNVYVWSPEVIPSYRLDLQFHKAGVLYDQNNVGYNALFGEKPRVYDWKTPAPMLRFWADGREMYSPNISFFVGSFTAYLADAGNTAKWSGINIVHMEAGGLKCSWHRDPVSVKQAVSFVTPHGGDWAREALFWMETE